MKSPVGDCRESLGGLDHQRCVSDENGVGSIIVVPTEGLTLSARVPTINLPSDDHTVLWQDPPTPLTSMAWGRGTTNRWAESVWEAG